MKLCGEGCTPCCDFCIYSIRDIWVDENGWESDQGPEGCAKYNDEAHQDIAFYNSFCEDFHCFRIKEK
jgi:hypothetical protein